MLEYISNPIKYLTFKHFKIPSFISNDDTNLDQKTVSSFGNEWLKFSEFDDEEVRHIGDEYFDIVPQEVLEKDNTIVLDAGCGSGRWTKYIASKVKFIEAIDPSNAVIAASHLTEKNDNVRITQASISDIPFKDNSFDFIICLGVLHHIPKTQEALNNLICKLKSGGSILLYLYYKLDNRGPLFKLIFHLSSLVRAVVSQMPSMIKKIICDLIALFIYLPFVALSYLLKTIFPKSHLYRRIPLSYYLGKSFYIIRNDALDRFGTPLEKRYTKDEIKNMMMTAGLENITFSTHEPYWHAIGYKKD